MLLAAEPSLARWMQIAFAGFAAFWVVVLVVLYVGVGALLEAAERRKDTGH